MVNVTQKEMLFCPCHSHVKQASFLFHVLMFPSLVQHENNGKFHSLHTVNGSQKDPVPGFMFPSFLQKCFKGKILCPGSGDFPVAVDPAPGVKDLFNLIGPGVSASHGYERIHKGGDGLSASVSQDHNGKVWGLDAQSVTLIKVIGKYSDNRGLRIV